MKKILFSDWTIFRVLKLIMGISLLVYWQSSSETIPGIIGIIAVFAGIFNVKSPCEQGDESCALPTQSSEKN